MGPWVLINESWYNLTTAALRHRPIADRPGKHWSLKTYDTSWPDGDEESAALAPDEQSGSAIRQILVDVRKLGYFVTFGVFDAADYGAPQHRLRFVMVGARDFPPPILPVPTYGSTQKPYRTVRSAIWGLRRRPGEGSAYTPAVERFFRLIPEGKNWRALEPNAQREAMGGSYDAGGGKTGFYRRLAWDRPAPTITGRANRKGSALCHPEVTRPLSVRECAALQGFPKDWHFSGAMNSQYMQIGNAVPVMLGEAIGSAIVGHNIQSDANRLDNYDEQLEVAVARLRASARNHRPSVQAVHTQMPIDFLASRHPVNRINPEVLARMEQAQATLFLRSFPNALTFAQRVLDDLKLSVSVHPELADQPASALGERPFLELQSFYKTVLESAGITGTSSAIHAVNLAQRTQLIRAFENPDSAVSRVTEKVAEITQGFPKKSGRYRTRAKSRRRFGPVYFSCDPDSSLRRELSGSYRCDSSP